MLTILIFIIVLSIIVLAHELGHFIVAKRQGMTVEEFGFGFPPRIFSFKKGETRYSINLIPFGGFVKILGESGECIDSPKSFFSKKIGQRAKVTVAGVAMNFLLAFILLTTCNVLGLRVGLDDNKTGKAKDIKIQIVQVANNSPVQQADIKPLDEILELRFDKEIIAPQKIIDVQNFVSTHKGETIDIKFSRGNEVFEKSLFVRPNPPENEGSLGVSLAKTGVVSYRWYEAIWRGAYDTGILAWRLVVGLVDFVRSSFVDGKVMDEVSGPVGIAIMTGQAAKQGFSYLLQFISLISINLAVINLIPFPALDGGRLLFLLIEKIKRKPVNRRVEGIINTAGFMLLIVLMIWITMKDVIRYF